MIRFHSLPPCAARQNFHAGALTAYFGRVVDTLGCACAKAASLMPVALRESGVQRAAPPVQDAAQIYTLPLKLVTLDDGYLNCSSRSCGERVIKSDVSSVQEAGKDLSTKS